MPDSLSLGGGKCSERSRARFWRNATQIEAFQAELEQTGIACRMLHTSHAFHSLMMDPALETFHQEVKHVALSTPRIPIASTLTGKILSNDEAVSVNYWTRHLRETVRFSQALLGLLADYNTHYWKSVWRATLSLLCTATCPKSRLAYLRR